MARARGRGRGLHRLVPLLVAFLVAATVLGVLAAGLSVPSVAALGALTSAGDEAFMSLPSSFTVKQLPEGSRILAADGTVIATPEEEDRKVVRLSQVAPIMRQAQVAIEDSRFYTHGAIDLTGLTRAVIQDVRTGTASEGASTLTQQFVKLTLQAQALREGKNAAAEAAVAKTLPRKLTELRYATGLERTWSKDEILQGYLNLAYYGDGAYGVEAAARHYFGVHASALTLPEAALLAGLVQSPSTTDPVHHPKEATARRNVVLGRMHELGLITTAQMRAAVRHPVTADLNVTYPRATCPASPYPYFCSFIINWLEDQPALGPTRQARRDLLFRGGLTVQTTLDPAVEKDANKALRAVAPENNGLGVAAAAYVTQPGTGNLLALGQDTAYGTSASAGQTEVNYAVDTAYGGSRGFQFGSTAKAFSLVTAMEQGLGTHASIDAPAAGPSQAATFSRSQFPQPCGLYNAWHVYNDTAWGGGTMPLMEATAQSTNTAFVALASKIGVCAIHKTMTAFGMHDASGAPIGTFPPQVVLGAQQVSPQTLANAYAALAAGGVLCRTRPVTSITQGSKVILASQPSCHRVADAGSVSQATQYLMYNMTHGSGILNQLKGRPSAGKTGTADGNAQSWFVGYTPQLTTAVWVGNPVDQTRRMFNVSMAGKSCTAMTGACYAAPIWRRIMTAALAGEPAVPMP
ncbi:transglycosylase domain-containing protein [Terrabacter sp. NPDC080008]|uniref:transglycosylase domain-containing protein n=1 Tax=Terrabacter sp. NPDC080008 TaxID=3155176 RepID=UPI00344F8ACC